MPTKFTADFAKPYMQDKKRHKAYEETVEIANRLKMHANGEKPGALLTDRRPNEDPEVQAYRNKIFVEITKGVFTKVLSCISKLRKSPDWQIKYDPEKLPSSIRKGETLEDYCEFNYPQFTSVTNWAFNVLLKAYLIDPNAVLLEMPLETKIPENQYLRPFSFIFDSDRVYDFVEDDFAVIHSTDKASYTFKDQHFYDGDVYYTVNTEEIQKWEQVSPSKDMMMTMQFTHGLGYMPCFKLKGLFKKSLDKLTIWESRIDAIVPRLNEAVREYSDLQGGVVTSLNMERWEYASQDCPECHGTCKVKKGTKTVKCEKCNGSGAATGSPYKKHVVKAPLPGQPAAPMPPAGFIQKDVAIIELQDTRVEKHIWWALSAINMEHLAKTPLSESGLAKEVDRDELNVLVNAIGEDVVAIMDKSYKIKCDIRYKVIVPDQEARKAMLPKIAVPEKLDLVNAAVIAQELAGAKTAKVNPILINALEMDYANKKFQNEPAIKDQINLVFTLDPFPGKDSDEKMNELQNGGIIHEDYVISCNIVPFVNRAIFENKDKGVTFTQMNLRQQTDVLIKYAQEKIKANSAAAAVMKVVQDEDEVEGGGGQIRSLNQ